MSQTWREWLAERRAASSMSVEVVPLTDVPGWGLQDDGSCYRRPDRKFFEIVGMQISVPRPEQREVVSWGQPAICEVGQGAVVLVETTLGFLIQAKAEPGNDAKGRVLLAPTLQASQSNLDGAHGGPRPPRADLLDNTFPAWTELRQDGGRFFNKVNCYAAIFVVGVGNELQLREDERWFTPAELNEAVLAGEVNEHLTQVFAIWHAHSHGKG
jgi:hypothetical protein